MNIVKEDILEPKGEIKEYCIVQEKKVFKASLLMHKGHKVWELDLVNQMVYEAELGEPKAVISKATGLIEKHRDLEQKENHIYCSALNFENAHKHFRKMLGVKPPKKKLPLYKVLPPEEDDGTGVEKIILE